jgi:hypothetical protein
MDAVELLALMTVVLAGVAAYAWRIGNERRDVALIGAFAGAFGASTAAVAIWG